MNTAQGRIHTNVPKKLECLSLEAYQVSVMQHSNFWGTLVSYKENEVGIFMVIVIDLIVA